MPKAKTAVKQKGTNVMRNIFVDKVTLHMCVGDNVGKLQNAKEILLRLSNTKPVEIKAKTKLPKWGIRPGLPIGAKVTLRGEKAVEFLKKVFKAYKNKIRAKCFDENGNFALGIKEYIEIPGMKYDPQLGLLGFDVIVNLKRKGYRIKERMLLRTRVGKNHRITKAEAIDYISKTYGVDII